MAFVNATPVNLSTAKPSVRRELALTPLTATKPTASDAAAVRMGYGAYSYSTDKTKGHVGQYYVDKFRVAADWNKGTPKTDADAVLGRTAKGGMAMPVEGIPQEMDAAIAPRDTSVAPDPRIAESEGVVYPWDVNYVDPQYLPSAYADVNDAEVADTAFAAFRSSTWESRGASLTAMDFGAVERVKRIKNGLDEKYLMTLDGMLDARYARLQKISEPPVLSPTGTPQTEIPGTPFLNSVGALNFMNKDNDSVAFWKGTAGTVPVNYKRPSGAETPELPYNTAVSAEQLQAAQKMREGVITVIENQE